METQTNNRKEMIHSSLYIKKSTKNLWDELASHMGISRVAVFELLIHQQAKNMGLMSEIVFADEIENSLHPGNPGFDKVQGLGKEKRALWHLDDSAGNTDADKDAIKKIIAGLETLIGDHIFVCENCANGLDHSPARKPSEPAATRGRQRKKNTSVSDKADGEDNKSKT